MRDDHSSLFAVLANVEAREEPRSPRCLGMRLSNLSGRAAWTSAEEIFGASYWPA